MDRDATSAPDDSPPGSVARVQAGDWTWGVRRWPSSSPTRRCVLLLHGWPGTSQDWAAVARLAASHSEVPVDVLCPDLIGFGDSDNPTDHPSDTDAFSPPAHVGRLISLLDQFGYEQVLVGGYDLGANLAQGLARELGDRVVGLLLCDPVHPAARAEASKVNLSAELWYQTFHLLPWAGELVGHDRATVEIYLRHFYTHWWGAGTVDDDFFQSVVDAYAAPGAFEASIGWYRSRHRSSGGQVATDASDERLSLPVEVLWGALDPITPIVFAGSLDRSFTDFRLTTLDDVGHFAPLEAPSAVADALRRLVGRVNW